MTRDQAVDALAGIYHYAIQKRVEKIYANHKEEMTQDVQKLADLCAGIDLDFEKGLDKPLYEMELFLVYLGTQLNSVPPPTRQVLVNHFCRCLISLTKAT